MSRVILLLLCSNFAVLLLLLLLCFSFFFFGQSLKYGMLHLTEEILKPAEALTRYDLVGSLWHRAAATSQGIKSNEGAPFEVKDHVPAKKHPHKVSNILQ